MLREKDVIGVITVISTLILCVLSENSLVDEKAAGKIIKMNNERRKIDVSFLRARVSGAIAHIHLLFSLPLFTSAYVINIIIFMLIILYGCL